MCSTDISQNDLNKTIYTETIADLRAKIESKYGSVQSFCEANGIDTANLYKVFNGTSGREMSVGLYARVLKGFGVQGLDGISHSNISLRQYLEIDHNALLKSILYIKFT